MITITRQQARAVRQVFRQALGVSARSRDPMITFLAAADALTIRGVTHNVAVERRIAGEYETETIHLPFHGLAECAGRDDEPVSLRPQGKQVLVEWHERDVPQTRGFDAPSDAELKRLPEFPSLPRRMQASDRELLSALAAAAETTDPESSRYALGCLCLRADDGRIAATDGRQIFAHGGFEFPWKGELLVPACKAFCSKEIAECETVAIGKTKDWLAIRCDDWTLLLRVNQEGRFPCIEDFVQPCEAGSTLRFSDADAEFFAKTAKKLPGDEEPDSPLTIELNGTVAVRAKGEQQPEPTELVLSSSRCSGQPICFQTNRCFLTRAVKLGFRELQLRDVMSPAYCRDGRRIYVWALLEPHDVIKPNENMTRIASPVTEDSSAQTPSSPQPQAPMPRRTKQHTNGQVTNPPAANQQSAGLSPANSPPADSPATGESNGASLPELAETLKSTLDTAQSQVRDLIAGLRKQRKQNRLVASTLQSLRELEELAV